MSQDSGMIFRKKPWPGRQVKNVYWSAVASGVGGLVIGCFLGSTVFNDYLLNALRWAGSFLMANGAAVATVTAALVALGGIAWQVRLARKTAQSNSWWQTFEWAAERAIPSKGGSIALPADTITSALNQLALDAPTDAQKQACSGIISLIADQLDWQEQATSERRPESEENSGRTADPKQSEGGAVDARPHSGNGDQSASVLDSMDRVSDEFFSRADPSERLRLALFTYSESTKGTAAASPRADALAYETSFMRSLESALSVRNPAAYESMRASNRMSDGGWDASIGNLGPRRVNLFVKYTTDAGAIRSAIAIAAKRQFEQHADSALVLVAPIDRSNMPEGWLPENVYFVSWKDESDTARLIDTLRLAARD